MEKSTIAKHQPTLKQRAKKCATVIVSNQFKFDGDFSMSKYMDCIRSTDSVDKIKREASRLQSVLKPRITGDDLVKEVVISNK